MPPPRPPLVMICYVSYKGTYFLDLCWQMSLSPDFCEPTFCACLRQGVGSPAKTIKQTIGDLAPSSSGDETNDLKSFVSSPELEGARSPTVCFLQEMLKSFHFFIASYIVAGYLCFFFRTRHSRCSSPT